MNNRNLFFLFPIVIGSLFASCAATKSIKNLPYFKDFPDSVAMTQVILPRYEKPTIQPQDMLNIIVDNKGTLSSGPSASIIQGQGTDGYLVNEEGYVTLPIFGNVKVAGMTTGEAQAMLQKKMDFLYNTDTTYKNAVVRVNFASIKIGVLGEVGKPGEVLLPTEKNTILDAIMAAGDLTVYGKRDNVVLMRDSAGIRTMRHLSLNTKDLMSSPYFYLKQNDIIYVTPDPAKGQTLLSPTFTRVGFGISIISFLTIMFIRLK